MDTSSEKNMFGGNYTLNKCEETCAILSQVEICNATFDHWKAYVESSERVKGANDCFKNADGELVKKIFCERKIRECLSNLLE